MALPETTSLSEPRSKRRARARGFGRPGVSRGARLAPNARERPRMSGRSVSNAARIAQATVAAFAGAPATLRHAMATAATAATTPLARSRVAPAGWSTTRACRSTPRAALTPGAVETRASWSALARARASARSGRWRRRERRRDQPAATTATARRVFCRLASLEGSSTSRRSGRLRRARLAARTARGGAW